MRPPQIKKIFEILILRGFHCVQLQQILADTIRECMYQILKTIHKIFFKVKYYSMSWIVARMSWICKA